MECTSVARAFSSGTSCELRVVDVPSGFDICQSTADALAGIWVLRLFLHYVDSRLPCARSAVLRRSLETNDGLWDHPRGPSVDRYVYHSRRPTDPF